MLYMKGKTGFVMYGQNICKHLDMRACPLGSTWTDTNLSPPPHLARGCKARGNANS